MARHSDHLRRKKSSVAVEAPVNLPISTFPSPMHTISPLPALDRTVANISRNSRLQILRNATCTESYIPACCRDEVLLPTKPNVSPTVASLLSAPDGRLTPLSNFPCKELPLPRVSPQCLDTANDEYFGVNTVVLVRRFNMKSGKWSEWKRGVVKEVKKATYLLGTYAREYRVKCLEMPSTTESYMSFLKEICTPTRPLPDITPEEYSLRLLRTSQVYARVPIKAACEDEMTLSVWTPSIVTGFKDGKISEVRPLGRRWSIPLKHTVDSHEILPYSPETVQICLENGHIVMAQDGRIFGPPLDPKNDSESSTSP